MTQDVTIAQELEQLGQSLADARVAVAAGQMVELTSLTEYIRDLCTRIEAEPRAEAEAYVPALLAMRGQLDRLAEDIHGFLNRMTGDVEDAGNRQAASTAYGKPPTPR